MTKDEAELAWQTRADERLRQQFGNVVGSDTFE